MGTTLDSLMLGFSVALQPDVLLYAFLGCLVGVVVVAQTLYASTMEHLREFGTVKAIGGSNWDIYKIITKQAGMSAVVGFVLGAVPSYAAGPLIAKTGLHLALSPEFILLVFVSTIGLCLLAAMVSFRKIAAIDPSLVFRT